VAAPLPFSENDNPHSARRAGGGTIHPHEKEINEGSIPFTRSIALQ
jgi:hypothetical protein